MAGIKHLMIIEDSEVRENSLHQSERARAERLIELIRDGSLGDDLAEQVAAVLQAADEEALAADYPEAVSPSLPRPEDYVDTLREWLASEGSDVFIETLSLPGFNPTKEVLHT